MARSLAAGVLSVVFLVGCGDSGRLSHREYQAKLDAITQRLASFGERNRSLGHVISSEYSAVLTQRYAALEERVATTLEGLRPPTDAERANALLARGSRDYATESRAALPGLETLALGEAPRVVDRRTAKARRELEQATKELRKAGYHF